MMENQEGKMKEKKGYHSVGFEPPALGSCGIKLCRCPTTLAKLMTIRNCLQGSSRATRSWSSTAPSSATSTWCSSSRCSRRNSRFAWWWDRRELVSRSLSRFFQSFRGVLNFKTFSVFGTLCLLWHRESNPERVKARNSKTLSDCDSY